MLNDTIKKLALKSLVNYMTNDGISEGRFWIENGEIQLEVAKAPDRFILKSSCDELTKKAAQIIKEKNEVIDYLNKTKI